MLLKHNNVFRNTDNEAEIAELKALGFEEVKEVKLDEARDLSKMSKGELVKEAKALGIDCKGLKKDELVAKITGE